MAIELTATRACETELKFECKGNKILFLLQQKNPGIRATLIPKENNYDLSIADLIRICELVKDFYKKSFYLKWKKQEISFSEWSDVQEDFLRQFKVC